MAVRRSKKPGSGPGARGRPGASRLSLVGGETYADWEAIYRDNVDRIYRVMFSKVGNRADAEDLTTEVFLAALRPLRTSATVPEVRAYLLATARTVLASHWRRVLGIEVTRLPEEHPQREPEPEEVPSDVPRRARSILDALPDRYRRILELRFLDASSLKEAAAELGVSVGNAKVLQYRALRHAALVAARLEETEG
ncbi:RNA polymerase sigma factor [Streptomyces sp. NPDC059070]|uniref:RNA polymerase sigma factor n=1 Tax=unclassified Streptomyces TaxID=2593676 RepID=UPI0034E25141